MQAREAAFLALVDCEKRFISETLSQWKSPSFLESQLAKQLSFGTCQRKLSLDFIAKQLSDRGTLKLKRKQKILLRLALYQLYFMEKIPPYAVLSTMGELAKKYGGSYFAKFLNALLRKAIDKPIELPEDLSTRFSYPKEFVDILLKERGGQAAEILAIMNQPAKLMARLRLGFTAHPSLISMDVPSFAQCIEGSMIAELAKRSDLYLQNCTPFLLMNHLSQGACKVQSILDLCAAPGGKLLIAHDLFPESTLFANDVSDEKVRKIEENLDKYQVAAKVSVSLAEDFSSDKLFDLIICDVPCSNSGVLNKRPEARWRLSKENIAAHAKLQKEILRKAAALLAKGGEIWYMTCSILSQENEALIQEMTHELKLDLRSELLHLPSSEGHDGGYGAALKRA